MADMKRYGKFDPRDTTDFTSDEAVGRNVGRVCDVVLQQTRRDAKATALYTLTAGSKLPSGEARAKFYQIWAEMGIASPARAIAAAFNWASAKAAHEWHMTDPDYRAAYEAGRIDF